MTLRQTILGALLLTATTLYAQPAPLHLCIVQPRTGYSSGEPRGEVGRGYDVTMLAKELASRKLADGTPIQTIPVVRKYRNDAEDEAHHQDCAFVIELWDHNSRIMAGNNSTPFSAGSPTTGVPGDLPYNGDIDNGIQWAMTRNSRKVIARGYLPPQPNYKGQTVNRTFPALATQITDKLNRIDKH